MDTGFVEIPHTCFPQHWQPSTKGLDACCTAQGFYWGFEAATSFSGPCTKNPHRHSRWKWRKQGSCHVFLDTNPTSMHLSGLVHVSTLHSTGIPYPNNGSDIHLTSDCARLCSSGTSSASISNVHRSTPRAHNDPESCIDGWGRAACATDLDAARQEPTVAKHVRRR